MKNKDAEILCLVREFRLVTERQLRELTGRQTLWRRLPVLVHQKKLYRRRQGVYQPYVYAAYNITDRKALDHDLMITELHIALYESGKLLEWEQPRQKLKGALNEDAYCVLSVGAKELRCFVEVDNGTEPDWQIRDKVERCLSHHYQTKKLFRALFVANDKSRVSELLRACLRVIPKAAGRMFLFAALPDLSRNCFAPICFVCHDSTQTSILPATSPST